MRKENYFILTGAMGAGKTTVLNILREKYLCISEPARIILKKQREKNSSGVPEKDAPLFNDLMLQKMTDDYNKYLNEEKIIIFDRGIPDIIAYSELLGTSQAKAKNLSLYYRYNINVFFFSGWEEIYTNDEERKINFETANSFGTALKKIYSDLNYIPVSVPCVSIYERSEFIKMQ